LIGCCLLILALCARPVPELGQLSRAGLVFQGRVLE
jgi:hypothetical protein